METRAVGSYIRVSPRKARLVVDQIRGRGVEESLVLLRHSKKSVARDIEKILRSAIANAEENHEFSDVENLYVTKAFVGGGPMMKRIRPRSMGMAKRRLRRTSHITIFVGDGGDE